VPFAKSVGKKLVKRHVSGGQLCPEIELGLSHELIQQMEIVETTTETPICPHCEKHIDRVLAKKIKGKLGVRYLYFCSHCKKALGVSHRKGFWMG